MRKILCLLGFHYWRRTTRSKSIDGIIKEYYKCRVCRKKKMYQWNPEANHYNNLNDNTC